jgi:hypothetical protein
MAIHHIIPKHEWKARFGNLRGVNAPDNLSPELYNKQHAQVHAHYFSEITHIEYDKIASLVISGQIGKEEAIRQAGILANSIKWKGVKRGPQSEAHRKALSISVSAAQLGKKRPHTKLKNIVTVVTCPHCDKVGGQSAMKRWHFDKCKRRS